MIPQTSQNMDEFNELLEIYVRFQPVTVLEIGTHHGGTLYHWLKNAVPGTIVGSIDNQGIVSEAQASEWAAESVTARCWRGDSASIEAITWARDNIAPIEWLFIDGGHMYNEVEADWNNYSPLVERGGIICFHDILPHPYSQVNELWNNLKQFYETQEIIKPHEEWKIGPGIGIIYK